MDLLVHVKLKKQHDIFIFNTVESFTEYLLYAGYCGKDQRLNKHTPIPMKLYIILSKGHLKHHRTDKQYFQILIFLSFFKYQHLKRKIVLGIVSHNFILLWGSRDFRNCLFDLFGLSKVCSLFTSLLFYFVFRILVQVRVSVKKCITFSACSYRIVGKFLHMEQLFSQDRYLQRQAPAIIKSSLYMQE